MRLLFVFFLFTSSLYAQTMDEYLRKSIAHFDRKEYDKALLNINQAIAKGAKSADVYYNRGLIYENLKKYEAAIKDYEKAIGINPTFKDAIKNKQILEKYLKDNEGLIPIEEFDKLPPKAIDLFDLGKQYFEFGRLKEALFYYDSLVKIAPNFYGGYYSRGLVYGHLGKHELAKKDLDKTIELLPSNSKLKSTIYYSRGLSKSELNDYAGADADYTKAIEINNNNEIAYFARGYLRVNAEKYAEAIADFTKAIEINPKYSQAFYMRGLVYISINEDIKGCLDLREAQKQGLTQANSFLAEFCGQ